MIVIKSGHGSIKEYSGGIMQEYIFGAIGIIIAIVCCIVGWWMENGPSATGKADKKDETDEADH